MNMLKHYRDKCEFLQSRLEELEEERAIDKEIIKALGVKNAETH